MNRWYVYEWIKQTYMFSGILPRRQDIMNQFRWTTLAEIEEGITEFELATGKKIPETWKESVYS